MNKEDFLKEYGEHYGYPNGPKSIDEIRATEFKRLENGSVYLDHAAATMYSELQMENIFKDLTTTVYGNPHSQSDSSLATCDIVREARQQVLDYFNASPKDYKCIFTSGATAALKLVGEAFPWDNNSCFMYTMENHNSVLGIREYALGHGASAVAVEIGQEIHHGEMSYTNSVKVSQHPIQRRKDVGSSEGWPTGIGYNLFAFPSECNFSGLRFSPNLVKIVKDATSEKTVETSVFDRGSWMVLIDAAKGCATETLDLSKYPADFVVISFYKLFGYPTGLGALIVHSDVSKLLKKKYFSGGTVDAAFADSDFVKRRESIEERFEDGTISFLSIASIRHGFKILNSLTVSAIGLHTDSLASYVRHTLISLKHDNGTSVCKLYGSQSSKVVRYESGPVISFNLIRPDRSWVGYREVEKLASLSGIQLRTGCFCNPGACAKYIGLSHSDLLSNIEAGHVCWDDNDIVHGKPTGAVRASFGYMSTYEDAKKLIDFIRSSFVTLPPNSGNGFLFGTGSLNFSSEAFEKKLSNVPCRLKSITVYPIKSCGGFTVSSWPLSSNGLLHDREWLLRSLTGEVLTQKKVPEMCLVRTFINLTEEFMFVESPRCHVKLQVDLKANNYLPGSEEIVMHAQRYKVRCYENEVNLWFSNAIGRPCVLLQYSGSELNESRCTVSCRDVESKLNFPNEAQILLVSEESVSDLNDKLDAKFTIVGGNEKKVEADAMRFRPNLVINGGDPYAEDNWRKLRIGENYFTSLGGCNRCQMINFTNRAGQVHKSNEPLATLASYRRVKGKILFGILLRYEYDDKGKLDEKTWLHVGQQVLPNFE